MCEPLNNPIFIVGHSRSGSTLLASLLGNSPTVAALPETLFFVGLNMLSMSESKLVSKDIGLYIDALYHRNPRLTDLSVSLSELRQAAIDQKLNTPQQVFNLLLTLNRDRIGKPRVLEKSPLHIEYLKNIFAWYPHAKVVCVVRDGRDAVESLMAVSWTHSNKERHAAYWAWCIKQAQHYLASHADNFMLIRYEDLLENPEQVLTKICEFSGVAFDPSMLAAERGNDVVPKWEAAWKKKSQSKLDPSFAYKWKKKSDTKDIAYIQWYMRKQLVDMQYELLNQEVSIPIPKALLWNPTFYSLLHPLLLRKFLFTLNKIPMNFQEKNGDR